MKPWSVFLPNLLFVSFSFADSQLQNPNYPIETEKKGFYGHMMNFATVGDIDGDLFQEIIFPGIANLRTIHAYEYNGTPVLGNWPVPTGYSVNGGVGYPAMANLTSPEVGRVNPVWGAQNDFLIATDGYGQIVSNGWIALDPNDVTTPPSFADVTGDGLDEMFIGMEDGRMHALNQDALPIPGWPVDLGPEFTDQDLGRATPAFADLDKDGDLEIITVSQRPGNETPYSIYVYALHHEGTLHSSGSPIVNGFPVEITNGNVFTFPVIGDVNNDGWLEIVLQAVEDVQPWGTQMKIISHDGSHVETIPFEGHTFEDYYSAPALADLNGDNVPEILAINNLGIFIWKYNTDTNEYEYFDENWPHWWVWVSESTYQPPGMTFEEALALQNQEHPYYIEPPVFDSSGEGGVEGDPCYPWAENYFSGKSGITVGDVDGDPQMELVFTTTCAAGNGPGQIHAFDLDGTELEGFPKNLSELGVGGVPAIADIDLDGRNEIIVAGLYYYQPTNPTMEDHLWVYDLDELSNNPIHGKIQWGQFQNGPKNQGLYVPPPANSPPQLRFDYDSELQMLRMTIYDPEGLGDLLPQTFSMTIEGENHNYFYRYLEIAENIGTTPVMYNSKLGIDLSSLAGSTLVLTGSDSYGNTVTKSIEL